MHGFNKKWGLHIKIKREIRAIVFFLYLPALFIFKIFLWIKFRNSKPNLDNVLIVYTEALGDFIMFTSALDIYKKEFEKSNKNLFLLVNKQNKIDGFWDEKKIFYYDDSVWKRPGEILRFINNNYRKFHTIINANTNQYENTTAHLLILFLGANLKIRLREEAFLGHFRKQYSLIENLLFVFFVKTYTKILESPYPAIKNDKITHVIFYHKTLVEYVFKKKFFQIVPSIDIHSLSINKSFLVKLNNLIGNKKFAVFVCGAGWKYREWPFNKFLDIAYYLKQNNIKSFFVGSKKDLSSFKELPIDEYFVNLMGKTSLSELFFLISESLLVIGNETGPIHAAIALKKPSICILGGGHFGRCSLYGYKDINIWVYRKTSCYLDNWMCGVKNTPSPCIDIVDTKLVKEKTKDLIQYILVNKHLPKEPFEIFNEL